MAPYARREGDAEPEMPEGLDTVIERAVAKDPAERYSCAGELIEAARERERGTPSATRVLSDPGPPDCCDGRTRQGSWARQGRPARLARHEGARRRDHGRRAPLRDRHRLRSA